jgi:hypothetical protein
MRNSNKFIKLVIALVICTGGACKKLDPKVYSVVPNQNFWQTPDQVAAGIAPAYAQLTSIPDGNFHDLQEQPSDELVVPARGNDWLAAGQHIQLFTHTWTGLTQQVQDTWTDLYTGITKINFILSIVNNLNPAPPTLPKINAELKSLRALYYYWLMDLYGNVPLVTDFATNPNSIKNSTRKEVYDFVEKELKDNLSLLPTDRSLNNYGRMNKYTSYCILAKLYLNSQVYVAQSRYPECVKMCDSVISAGYSLQSNYFDNFSINNEGSSENIFVVPFDHVNIGGNNFQTQTLHYQNDKNYQIAGGGWNGYCTNAEFYSHFDTTSTYAIKGNNTYRTYNDARSGQFIIGQQFSEFATYPPNTNVLTSSTDESLKIKDSQTGKFLSFYADIKEISNPADTFRLAGLRSVKYFPNPGVQTSMSNDMVIFRLADVLLMRAEAALRSGTASGVDLDYINQIRMRAYSGVEKYKWTMGQLTLQNVFDERGRELAWENFRRQDCIRFGTFGNARKPQKLKDADDHWQIFPIPNLQHTTNPNLVQNPGYPAF